MLATKGLHQSFNRLGLRNEKRRPRQLPQRELIRFIEIAQNILRMNNPHHVVETTVIDGEPRMSGLSGHLHNILEISIHGEADNLCPWHHNVADTNFREVEDAVQHAPLILADHSGIFAKFDN